MNLFEKINLLNEMKLEENTYKACYAYLEGALTEEEMVQAMEEGLIDLNKIEEGILDTMSFETAPKRKAAHLLVGGNSLLGHLIDRSHHKEIAEKLKNAGVSSEQLKKVKMLKDFADRNPSSPTGRTFKNVGRGLAKVATLANPVGALLGHSIHKTHMRDLRDKLEQAGVKHDVLDKVHELKKDNLK